MPGGADAAVMGMVFGARGTEGSESLPCESVRNRDALLVEVIRTDGARETVGAGGVFC